MELLRWEVCRTTTFKIPFKVYITSMIIHDGPTVDKITI